MKSNTSRQHFNFSNDYKSSGLISGMDGRRSSSLSSTSNSSTSSGRGRTSGKMKLIIILGVLLPVFAAVIGVTAWAVSAADSVFLPKRNRLRAEQSADSYDDSYLNVLESRNDLDHSPNNMISMYSKADADMPSRLEKLGDASGNGNGEFQLPTLPPKGTGDDDPLYIVHFVPSPPTKSVDSDDYASSTESSQLIDKIISASKGKKNGVPQFVVFAPGPAADANVKATSEEDSMKTKETRLPSADSTRNGVQIGATAMQQSPQLFLDNSYASQANDTAALDYRSGGLNPYQSAQLQQLLQQHQVQQHQVQQQTGLRATQHVASHSVQHNEQYYHSPATAHQKTHQPQQYTNHAQNPALGASNPQTYVQNPQTYVQNPQTYVQNPQTYVQNPQAYVQSPQTYPQTLNHQPNHHKPQPNTPGQPDATARLGEIGPVGVKLSFGNGGGLGGLGGYGKDGGGYGYRPFSPLGIIQAILRPVIPRANANLNGKVMFGMMLENGVKFGDRKPQPQYYEQATYG